MVCCTAAPLGFLDETPINSMISGHRPRAVRRQMVPNGHLLKSAVSFPYRAVTFDCFGTLIDWQRGQTLALAKLPSLAAHASRLEEIMQARGPIEIELEAGPWMPYREILARSIQRACQQVCGVKLSEDEADAFAASQPHWPPFADTVAALQQLAQLTTVGLLSNCDHDVLLQTAQSQLQTDVQLFVSAEQVRSYKPAHGHWHRAVGELSCTPADVLHVSFTRHYDLNPAHELGFPLGFLQRYQTPTPTELPIAHQAKDLQALVEDLQVLAAG